MRALEFARSRRCFFLTTEGEEASRGGGGPGEKGGSQARAAAVPHPSRVRPLFSLAPIFPPPPPSGTARQLGTIVSAKREAEASDGDLGAHYGVSILLGRRDEPLIATAARVRRGGKTFGPARILPFSLFPSFPFLGPWFFVRARARGADARAARLSPALSTLTVSRSIASLGGARQRLVEVVSTAGCARPILLCLGLMDHRPEVVRAVVEALTQTPDLRVW